MLRTMFKAKIHRATVTHGHVHYVGSLTLDADLMDAADLLPGERVAIVDVDNGARLETYLIPGERGTRTVGINGAAVAPGASRRPGVIISYAVLSDSEAAPSPPLWSTSITQPDCGHRHRSGTDVAGVIHAQPPASAGAGGSASPTSRRPSAKGALGDAHQLRPVHRRAVRRGRRLGAAGRRLGGQQRLRLRDHAAGHGRRAAAAGPGRGPVHPAGLRGRRPAVRLLRGRPVTGAGDRHPVHEGGRLPRGEVRGRRTGRRRRSARSPTPASRSWATSASPRRASTSSAATGSRAAATPPNSCWPTPMRWPTPARSAWCWRWCRASWPSRSPPSWTSPRSASARDRTATPRCWSGRTWSGCAGARCSASSSSTPTSPR